MNKRNYRGQRKKKIRETGVGTKKSRLREKRVHGKVGEKKRSKKTSIEQGHRRKKRSGRNWRTHVAKIETETRISKPDTGVSP